MEVKLGAVAMQPLRIHVPASPSARKGAAVVTVAPVMGRLPGPDRLGVARTRLQDAIREYVPATTTADGWVAEFENFCRNEKGEVLPSAELFSDFAAMLHYRCTLEKGVPGRLEVSSVNTYLGYVVKKYKRFALLPAMRAIATKAGSILPQHKAPTACTEHMDRILDWIHMGPADKLMLRGGAWLQCATGGRPIDICRLRGGGLRLQDRVLRTVDWRWTKSIKNAKDAKGVWIHKVIQERVGQAPFSDQQWLSWSGEDKMLRPFEDYTADDINEELETLSHEFDAKATSTTLRDFYNELMRGVCENDTEQMVLYTPHKSAKSLRASYTSGRTTTKKLSPGEVSSRASKKKAVRKSLATAPRKAKGRSKRR